jgi:hypothetical protein
LIFCNYAFDAAIVTTSFEAEGQEVLITLLGPQEHRQDRNTSKTGVENVETRFWPLTLVYVLRAKRYFFQVGDAGFEPATSAV